MTLSRRDLIRTTALAGLGVAVVGNVDAVFGSSPAAATPHPPLGEAGYGPLVPDPAGLLDLPEGFRYRVVTRAGDPLVGATGVVPGRQDGTGAFRGKRGDVYLVQNHEQSFGSPFPAVAAPELTYDPAAQGGTTTLRLDHFDRVRAHSVSLAGTFSNCAGGVTPWGTWLTCEETEARASTGGLTKDHGFVFEVSPDQPEANTDPVPLTALGRFAHEAVAVDPVRGRLYLTEDASGPNGLFYRFTPKRRICGLHTLREGGTLEAMLVPGVPDLSVVTEVGTELPVAWKRVPDPLAATTSVRKQFDSTGITGTPGGAVTRSRKFEGTWWGRDQVWVVCSYARLSDGSAAEHDGQVWSYDPRAARLRLEVRFGVNPDTASDQPDGPDNITVSPYGGLILAEDGEGVQHLLGVTDAGSTYLLARNALNQEEFTGPTFSPDGRTLFANMQDPGIVFAIRGPWRRQAPR